MGVPGVSFTDVSEAEASGSPQDKGKSFSFLEVAAR